jgi:hypothetical protein
MRRYSKKRDFAWTVIAFIVAYFIILALSAPCGESSQAKARTKQTKGRSCQ